MNSLVRRKMNCVLGINDKTLYESVKAALLLYDIAVLPCSLSDTDGSERENRVCCADNGENTENILVCAPKETENAQLAAFCGVVVIYSDDKYIAGTLHKSLSKMFGEKYAAVRYPFYIPELSYIATKLCGGFQPAGFFKETEERDNKDKLTVSREKRSVTYLGRTVKLTATEFMLLEALLAENGSCVTREKLLGTVWRTQTSHVDSNKTDVYISYLRKKLSSVLGEGVLTSVRKKGYILSFPEFEYE